MAALYFIIYKYNLFNHYLLDIFVISKFFHYYNLESLHIILTNSQE